MVPSAEKRLSASWARPTGTRRSISALPVPALGVPYCRVSTAPPSERTVSSTVCVERESSATVPTASRSEAA